MSHIDAPDPHGTRPSEPWAELGTGEVTAVLFDLDGVLTPTVDVHRRAWAETCGPVFAAAGVAPYTDEDYFNWLDGRPRTAGIVALLASRGLELPAGAPGDNDLRTVTGIGERKNQRFLEVIASEGIRPYPGSAQLVAQLAAAGVPMGVVTSSRNAPAVLSAAGLGDQFLVLMDGTVAAERGLRGKPAPDTFNDAARQLGADPAHTAVFEDAVSGVAAAHTGGFRQIIGVDRGTGATALRAAGATRVVTDLAELAS